MKRKTEDVEVLFPTETTKPKTKIKSNNLKAKYIIPISLICVISALCIYGGMVVLMEKEKTSINAVPLQINDKQVDIKDITIQEVKLGIGETKKVTINIIPRNATAKNLVWSIDNSEVAIVNSNGDITGMSIGEANLTVATEDGQIAASTKIVIDGSIVENENNCIIGDANGDNIINNFDILYLMNYLNNNLDNENINKCLDLNQDNKIDFLDLIELKKLI